MCMELKSLARNIARRLYNIGMGKNFFTNNPNATKINKFSNIKHNIKRLHKQI